MTQLRPKNKELLEHMELMKEGVGRRIAVTRERNKNDYNKNGGQECQVHFGDKIWIYRPQYAAFESKSAKKFAQRRYTLLMSRRQEPYTVS